MPLGGGVHAVQKAAKLRFQPTAEYPSTAQVFHHILLEGAEM